MPQFIYWYLDQITFPTLLRFQERKLSASGVDMGGAMLFSRRIGFSGTPSDLLPRDLGKCQFEPSSEGQIVHTLTDPEVMSAVDLGNEIEMGRGAARDESTKSWAKKVLDFIATKGAGRYYHALIDVGAVITGMSNFQVARYLVSKDGFLPDVDGVVFLDESSRKMIYTRHIGSVVRLEESSIREERRFTFYDQIHTTGTDIRHRLTARAALTLGKVSVGLGRRAPHLHVT